MLPAELFKSSIGKKAISAITGLILFAFVVGHLLGNLQIYMGQNQINVYSQHLRDMGALLWSVRIFLLMALLLHIFITVKLARENRAARPIPYVYKDTVQTSFASVTMMISGLIIFAYIIYHLLHFTFRITNPSISYFQDAAGRFDVYSMMVMSFRNYAISAAYIISMALLCLHLSHGLSSWCQSLGFNDAKWDPCLKRVGRFLALAIFLGYSSIPVSVLLNIIKLPVGRI